MTELDGHLTNPDVKSPVSEYQNMKDEYGSFALPSKETDSIRRDDEIQDAEHSQLHKNLFKKIGLAPLVVLIFYSVSGGPFGIEDIVRAGGPFYALMGFSLLLVWAVPEALITAELSTAMPEASGSVAWVETAFGPFW